jgi:hypothetical protein
LKLKLYFCGVIKNGKIMALETKPIPVLRGKAAKDFWKKVENFTISESKEEVQAINRKWKATIEQSRVKYV